MAGEMRRAITPQIGNFLRSLQDRTDLRMQFGLAMSLLSFLMIAMLATGASIVGERQARSTTSEGLVGLATFLADRIDRGLAQRAGMVELLARSDPIKPVLANDPAAARRVLQQSLTVMAGGGWLRFANSDGIVTAAAKGLREGEGVKDQGWFQHGLAGTAVQEASESNFSISGLAPDGTPYSIVDIAAPVRDDLGRPVGVLAYSPNWMWAANLRQETLNRSGQAETKELWILSRDGRMIVGPQVNGRPYSEAVLSRMLEERTGSFSDDSRKDAILTGFSIMDDHPGVRWIVVARQPEALAFAAARNVVSTIVSLGIVTALAGILASLFIAAHISQPITRLAEEADLIERHSVKMLPRERGSVEVVRLSSALRALVVRIGSAEERTAEAELRAADAATRFSDDIARLRTLADTDPLTQLPNRRRFLDLASEAMEIFRLKDRAFGILMIDVDRFKSVNDRFGHAAGDRVIQLVGAKISASLRPTDVAARFGGEEFIALVPDISLGAAEELAERIRHSIASEPLQGAGISSFVTASIGVAVIDAEDRDVEELIARADLALYRAKANGRNAVVAASREPARRVA